jgi:mannose-6-phosphate isomerase-like protein (cupin superfamily)
VKPYVLKAGQGWLYRDGGVDFIVKAGEVGPGRRVAVLAYRTTEDEFPGHTHRTEDEIFYVLQGSVTFNCGDDLLEAETGSFVFLPRGIKHGYRIRGGGEAHLLVITSPADAEAAGGWGGFIGEIETSMNPIPPPGLA